MSMPNSNAADDAAAKAAAASPEARERCTALCTKAATGRCTLCESLAARDAFLAAWRSVFAMCWAFLSWPFVRVWSWVVDLWLFIDSSKGYKALGVLIAAYVGLYAIFETRHERHLNRALFERNAFMTMVATGPSGFKAAMDQFANIQNQKAPIEPNWLQPPWQWFGEYSPNREPLKQWTEHFLSKCKPETCGTLAERDDTDKIEEGSRSWRIDLSFAYLMRADLGAANLRGANLRGAFFGGANLQMANLQGANLRDAGLPSTDLGGARLRGADLGNALLRDANLRGANLQGANLENVNVWYVNLKDANLENVNLGNANLLYAIALTQKQINEACVYKNTKLPKHIKRPNKNPAYCPPEPDEPTLTPQTPPAPAYK